MSECRETHFCKNLYIEWIYKILFYVICGIIQLYIAYIILALQWASTRDASNRVPPQNAASERMNLQNHSCVPTLCFASGRRKSCPFMLAVSRSSVVFDAALMVKEDLSTLMFQFQMKLNNNRFQYFVVSVSDVSWCWQWNVWSLIYLDFRFCYQISSSEEHWRYLMFQIVFSFAVHLYLSNFKIFQEQFFPSYVYQSFLDKNTYTLCGYSRHWNNSKLTNFCRYIG